MSTLFFILLKKVFLALAHFECLMYNKDVVGDNVSRDE